MDVDMRLIQNCKIDVNDTATQIKVSFDVITKDSLNPAISNLIFLINKSKNQITDIQKYFQRANELCVSTQKWADEIKNKLITRLTQLISIIPNTKKVKPNEVSDPGIKMKLQDIDNKLNEVKNKTILLEDQKKALNENILRFQKEIDEKSRSLVILQKQQELNQQKADSAKKAIEDADKQIKDVEKNIKDTNTSLSDIKNKTETIK